MYTIEIEYRTGDSFRTEETTGLVGMVWEDIEVAKRALADIKEHTYYHREVESSFRLTDTKKNKLWNELKTKPWFRGEDKRYPYEWFYSMQLETDTGDRKVVSAFWVGYFEKILGAKIVIDGDSELQFSIYD